MDTGTQMRSVGFLALDREKIGTKLYGYVLAKRYTSVFAKSVLARLDLASGSLSVSRDTVRVPGTPGGLRMSFRSVMLYPPQNGRVSHAATTISW